jgi:hypothetical protein
MRTAHRFMLFAFRKARAATAEAVLTRAAKNCDYRRAPPSGT